MENTPKKKIVLTGGGTAGHVSPNIALLPYLQEAGYEVTYIGSKKGIEKNLIADFGLPYVGISTGKLRRYFDVKNFTDPFRVVNGYREARKFLKKYKPDVVFSKGGFVSVPVVRAAGSLHIPCVIHESDMTPGLANKLCFRAAKKICCNFPETLEMLPKGKAVLTGTPIRGELFTGDKARGLEICGFTADKPVLMIMGGSQGSVSVNNAVRGNLAELLETFQIVHLCGKGHFDENLKDVEGYCQFEYVKDDLKHLFAAADLLVSRAGANAICEILPAHPPAHQRQPRRPDPQRELLRGAGLQRSPRGREGHRPDRRQSHRPLREPVKIYRGHQIQPPDRRHSDHHGPSGRSAEVSAKRHFIPSCSVRAGFLCLQTHFKKPIIEEIQIQSSIWLFTARDLNER